MQYVSLHGIPLWFEFEWPVRPSGSGSDWFVLHGRATVADGGDLHAEVSVNISRALVTVFPSLDTQDVRPAAINSVRKAVDTLDIEFLKSGKRQPIQCSSRVYSLMRKEWTFNDVSDAEMRAFLERKVYWDCVRGGQLNSWLADPVEALYLNSTVERLLKIANEMDAAGEIRLQGDLAGAADGLRAQAAEFDRALAEALAALHAKHAYEKA